MKLKHIINNPVISTILCFLGSLYIRLIYRTQWWKQQMPDEVRSRIREKKPIIFAFWHGRLLLAGLFSPRNMQNNVIISLHKDGEWITRIVRFLGQRIIRGSSSKGGAHALKQAIDVFERPANTLSITPDGPRGPRMRVNGNIVEIAKRSGAPIVAFTYSTSRATHLNTWDRFLLSHPFGKAIAIFGQPHYIDSDASKDDVKAMEKLLEDEMIMLTQQADKAMGHDFIYPADQHKQKRKGT